MEFGCETSLLAETPETCQHFLIFFPIFLVFRHEFHECSRIGVTPKPDPIRSNWSNSCLWFSAKTATALLLFWGDKPVRLRFGVRRCCAAFGRHLEQENIASRLRHRHSAKQAWPSPKCPGRTHPLTDFRNAAPTSSRQVITIRLITFARPSASMFWRAVFSPLRGTFRGDSKLGQYSRIITTLWLILRTIRKARAATHKCWPCFIRVPVDG